MALQPAAGAKDLNPRDVELNRRIADQLATVYRLWGYQEVAPPSFETLETLQAGGAIDDSEVVRLSSDEPLGLRPELTASIARAASTRMAQRPRPLRLWAMGPIFRTSTTDSGTKRISEQLQSGVELLGIHSAAADGELLRLLLAAAGQLGLKSEHRPTLLIGHHGLLAGLLDQIPGPRRPAARAALTNFDSLGLAELATTKEDQKLLSGLMRLRGKPESVLQQLMQTMGSNQILEELDFTLKMLAPAAARLGVALQLDPSFQPHFDLYDGLVFKLVCQGPNSPLEIASGGRYDALVGRFSPATEQPAGMGFGFAVEAVRELLYGGKADPIGPKPVLVAYSSHSQLAAALDRLESIHGQGVGAELLSEPVGSQAEAQELANRRGGCERVEWVSD